MQHRVVQGGRLREAGDQRRLDHRQVLRRLREVSLRGRLDAVGVVAEVDLVHPGGEDALLRPVATELDRQAGLFDLPLERPLPRDVEVADELLRDRRAALDHLAPVQVAPGGADDALVVDAAVLVEAAVLDRDRRLHDPRADLLQRHRLAVVLRRDRPEQRAVGRVDERVRTDRHRAQRRERAAGLERRGCAERGQADHERDTEQDDEHDRGGVALAVTAAANALPPLAAPAVRQVVEAMRSLRAHAKTPASRSRLWPRRRSSCSRRSASDGSEASARSVICGLPSMLETNTSRSRSPSPADRSRSMT